MVHTCTSLSKHKVVWSEQLSKWSSTNSIHCTRLKINEDSAGNIFLVGGLPQCQYHWRRTYFDSDMLIPH